jgi:hypothetical protein
MVTLVVVLLPVNVCTIDRLDFSNETVSAPTSSITQARRGLAGVSAKVSQVNKVSPTYTTWRESANFGYFSTIDRLDFSNETVSNPPASLTQARGALAATSSSSYGYFGGGATSVNVCTIDRLDFSNETVSNPPASLTQARRNLAATSSSSYGYFGGGYIGPPGIFCTIDRLDFSNETVSNPPASLTQARSRLAAVQK